MKSSSNDGIVEIDFFRIRVKNVYGSPIREILIGIFECRKQELVELLALQIVVHDFHACAACVVARIRRVGNAHIRLFAIHEKFYILGFCRVGTKETMLAQKPQITGFYERLRLQGGIFVEVIFLCLIVRREQIGNFRFVETRERYIEVHALQGFHLDAQHFLVPARIEREAVVCEDVRFLLRFREVIHEYTRNLLDVLRLRGEDSAMSRYDVELPVDDDRIHEAELTERRTQLGDLLLRVGAGVIHIRDKLSDGDKLHFGCGFSQEIHLLQ